MWCPQRGRTASDKPIKRKEWKYGCKRSCDNFRCKTPIGAFGGTLRDVLNVDLAAKVMDEVCRRSAFPKEELDDVYWGVVMVRSDENGMARSAVLKAGIPDYVSAVQVNRACCSSMEAIRIASMAIRQGEAKAIIAGGSESMSNVSYSIKNARWGMRLQHQGAYRWCLGWSDRSPHRANYGYDSRKCCRKIQYFEGRSG